MMGVLRLKSADGVSLAEHMATLGGVKMGVRLG
jgi:hypothetical protein